MPADIVIEPLGHHRSLLPWVARWFADEWPGWYGPGGAGDLQADLQAYARSERDLPVGLIAFEHGRPVGTAALKASSISSHSHLSPWAGAGFVLPASRRRGIGAALLAALARQAHDLGYTQVFCATSTAQSLLVRAGWVRLEVITHDGKDLALFSKAV